MEFIKTDSKEFNRQLSFTSRPEFYTHYSEAALDCFDKYVSIGGGVGYALHNHEILNVFNNSHVKLCGREAMQHAISKGGNRVFCIGDFLCKYYERLGFEIEDVIQWDDSLAPEGWHYLKYGRPFLFVLTLKED